MTQRKNTKRALLASVLSIVLCAAMLVGLTFAWFTDGVSTESNKIVAGNLDVALYNVDGDVETEVTENTNLFDSGFLWEPGHVEVVNLKIANLGSLALTYQFAINVTSEKGSVNVYGNEFKLSDYIEFAVIDGNQSYESRDAAITAAEEAGSVPISQLNVNDEDVLYPAGSEDGISEKYVTLVVYMPTSVGNDANYMTAENVTAPEINLGVTLVATQTPYESDSFDEYYDEGVAYPVTTAEELEEAFEQGGIVALANDIEISSVLSIPEGSAVVLDLNEKTITSTVAKAEDANGSSRPIENYGTLTVIGNGVIDTSAANGFGAIRNYGELTIESGTFKGDDQANGSAIDTQSGGNTVINGGTFYATAAIMNRAGGTTVINDGDFEGVSNDNEGYTNGVWSYAIQNYGDMTINGGNLHGSMNGGIAGNQGTVTINDGYFSVEAPPSGMRQSFYVLVSNPSSNGKFVINGGIFEQKNGTDRLLGGYTGMPSWSATSDLAANGYTINGGTFIHNGTTVDIG